MSATRFFRRNCRQSTRAPSRSASGSAVSTGATLPTPVDAALVGADPRSYDPAMPIATRYEQVQAGDDGVFEAFCAVPDGGSGPGVLLFQEIFGINDNMRGLAERLAGEGYVTLVPDMFWRLEPRFERKDESGMADAFAMVQRFDRDKGIADIQATH